MTRREASSATDQTTLQRMIEERDATIAAMANANRELKAQRDKLLDQVNALIESCYYRTRAGKVCWRQGRWFGVSRGGDDDPESYLQAVRAIRRNADIQEVVVEDDEQ